MDQKIKFIGIGLIIFAVVCLFLFVQATGQQQNLLRERNDLKAENTTLLNKVNQLENDLKANQGRIDSLQSERDRGAEALRDLQGKLELVARTRDELVQKLKKSRQEQEVAVNRQQQQQQAPTLENTDAYWGQVLSAKTDLEMQLTNIRQELRELQISNEALQREKGILEIDINRLGNEKKDLSRQLDYNQKLLDSMSQEVVRERNDKVAIRDSYKTIKSDNDVLSRQLKSLTGKKEVLDKKVQELTEGKSALSKRLSEMEVMLNEKISQIDSLRGNLNTLNGAKQATASAEKKESVDLPAIVVRSSPASEKSNAEIPEYSGKILAINTENNFVVIDLGSSVGVKVGDQFNVYRAGDFIGNIEVIQARENISACDIKKVNTALKIGDNIS